MIRLLLDQGLPRSAVRLLGDVGWNVVHAGDIGMARSSDSDILDYARRERRVCVTLDADFHAHLGNVVHAGDIGMARSSDSDILDYARRERRVCVTLDADFHAHLAVSGAARPSTVRVRIEGLNGCAVAELLKKVWPVIGDALDRGAMATITERDIRLHRLPIGRSDEQEQ